MQVVFSFVYKKKKKKKKKDGRRKSLKEGNAKNEEIHTKKGRMELRKEFETVCVREVNQPPK